MRAAGGSATEVDVGEYAYRVVAGDAVRGIAIRFGVCIADLFATNPGLRWTYTELQLGETLTIARIATVDHDADTCLTTATGAFS